MILIATLTVAFITNSGRSAWFLHESHHHRWRGRRGDTGKEAT